MTPALNPRGRARDASKTPYSRVNAIDNLHPNLQEIIKNCPALNVILDNETPRSSTHNRARDKDHVRRPPNAFMVYRSYVWHTKQLEDKDEKSLSSVSRLAGRSWQVMSDQARYPFRQVADIAKREHAARNPDYKYAPSSRSQTPGKKPPRRVSRAKVKAKAKVKETATHRDAGFDTLPLSKDTTPTPASTPPTSSELSCSPASSPSSPPTSPTFKSGWAFIQSPPSWPPGYPCDGDHTDYPPQPCVRPVTSGLIPSPSMSVLHLNDAHTPSILDELPDKYEEAGSFHDLQSHPLIHVPKKEIPLDGVEPNTQMSGRPAPVETIDYSGCISGNPEVNLGSPTPDSSPTEWCFPPGPSNATAINDDFNPSSALNWSAFDMSTLDFGGIVDEPSMYTPDDVELFNALIAYDH